jgi:hypothetical protein
LITSKNHSQQLDLDLKIGALNLTEKLNQLDEKFNSIEGIVERSSIDSSDKKKNCVEKH